MQLPFFSSMCLVVDLIKKSLKKKKTVFRVYNTQIEADSQNCTFTLVSSRWRSETRPALTEKGASGVLTVALDADLLVLALIHIWGTENHVGDSSITEIIMEKWQVADNNEESAEACRWSHSLQHLCLHDVQ